MTIINSTEKNKNKGLNSFLVAIVFVLLVSAVFYIYQYNLNVNLKHQLKLTEKKISEAEILNAQLKDDFYKTIEPTKLKSLLLEKGLVLEKEPQYLDLNKEQWVVVSSF